MNPAKESPYSLDNALNYAEIRLDRHSVFRFVTSDLYSPVLEKRNFRLKNGKELLDLFWHKELYRNFFECTMVLK